MEAEGAEPGPTLGARPPRGAEDRAEESLQVCEPAPAQPCSAGKGFCFRGKTAGLTLKTNCKLVS